ncbi:MAG: ribonuclease HI, partial [Bdellovibrionales bacterium]|nr:ribonuclease HI [Oligoflexia bacterium]
MEKFIIIADGACSKNPGPGGWGLIVIDPQGLVRELGGHEDATTNNRMEMTGYYRGLQEVYKKIQNDSKPCIVHAITDSKYVMDGAKSFAKRWSKTGWKTVAG